MTRRTLGSTLRQIDWDAIAGIAAAVVALVLHLLHIVDAEVLLPIILVVLALLLLRDLRREGRDDQVADLVAENRRALQVIEKAQQLPDAILVGPRQLRSASESFAREARGDTVWFNVCLLMFRPQALFDAILRPAVENPQVTSIQFVLDESERDAWRDQVLPKVAACRGAEKVREPHWCMLQEAISFILAESHISGGVEAQVSFWGEPFMSRTTGRQVPRYVFHVQSHSELIPQLFEMERRYRLATGESQD
jgi:hypothetical protein